MLDVMRRQSYLIYLIFGAIIAIFAINFGPGSSGCARGLRAPATWAARVNGEVIKPQDFGAQLGQRMDALRRMAEQRGQDFDPMMAERMGVRRLVLDQMVERRLVAQEAKKNGIEVPDRALLRYLRTTFGVHKVSYRTYEDWVARSFGTTVAHFEDQARKDAAGELLVRAIQDGVTVGDEELKRLFRRDNDRVRGSFVAFAAREDAPGVPEPDAQAIDAALEQEAAAIDSQYHKDIALYRTPNKVHFRQIVRALSTQATDEEEEAARQVLTQVRAKLNAGADFAALAHEFSQDTASRERGGDMGLVEQGTLAPALERMAFGLQPNAVAPEPVRTPEGLHLIQTVEVQPAGLTPLDAVRRDVAKNMLRDRAAAQLASARAKDFLAQLKQGKAITALTVAEDAEAITLKSPSASGRRAQPVLRDFGWTRRTDEAVARIGVAPQLMAALFAQNLDKPVIEQVFQVGDIFYVAVLKDRETPQMDQFASSKEALREEALALKQRRVLTDWVAYLRTQGNVELNPAMLSVPVAAQDDGDEAPL
jgi:peptidyl-prolyl cis-trans isomerase D